MGTLTSRVAHAPNIADPTGWQMLRNLLISAGWHMLRNLGRSATRVGGRCSETSVAGVAHAPKTTPEISHVEKLGLSATPSWVADQTRSATRENPCDTGWQILRNLALGGRGGTSPASFPIVDRVRARVTRGRTRHVEQVSEQVPHVPPRSIGGGAR